MQLELSAEFNGWFPSVRCGKPVAHLPVMDGP